MRGKARIYNILQASGRLFPRPTGPGRQQGRTLNRGAGSMCTAVPWCLGPPPVLTLGVQPSHPSQWTVQFHCNSLSYFQLRSSSFPSTSTLSLNLSSSYFGSPSCQLTKHNPTNQTPSTQFKTSPILPGLFTVS